MNVSKCPICGDPVKLKNSPRLGQTLTCSGCDAELEVVNISPFELDVFDIDKSTSQQFSKNNLKCLVCLTKIPYDKELWVGDRIDCPTCGAELLVTSLNPVELDWSFSSVGFYPDEDEFEQDRFSPRKRR